MKGTSSNQDRAAGIWPETKKGTSEVIPNVYWMKFNYTGFTKMFNYCMMQMLYLVRSMGISAIQEEIRNAERYLNILKKMEKTWHETRGWKVEPPGKRTVTSLRLTFMNTVGSNGEVGFSYWSEHATGLMREMGQLNDTPAPKTAAPTAPAPPILPATASSPAPQVGPKVSTPMSDIDPAETEYPGGVPDEVYAGPASAEEALELGIAKHDPMLDSNNEADERIAALEKGQDATLDLLAKMQEQMTQMAENFTKSFKTEPKEEPKEEKAAEALKTPALEI